MTAINLLECLEEFVKEKTADRKQEECKSLKGTRPSYWTHEITTNVVTHTSFNPDRKSVV